MVDASIAEEVIANSSPETEKNADMHKRFMDGTAFNLGCVTAFGLIGYSAYKFCAFFHWKEGQIAAGVLCGIPIAYYAYYLSKNKKMVTQDIKKLADTLGALPRRVDRLLDKMAENAIDQNHMDNLRKADFISNRQTKLEAPGDIPPSPPREKCILF